MARNGIDLVGIASRARRRDRLSPQSLACGRTNQGSEQGSLLRTMLRSRSIAPSPQESS
jgi:hypothetical protein